MEASLCTVDLGDYVIDRRICSLAPATDIHDAGRGDGPSRKHFGARNILDSIANHDAIVYARHHVDPVNWPNLGCRDVTVDTVDVVDFVDVAVARDVADALHGVVPI